MPFRVQPAPAPVRPIVENGTMTLSMAAIPAGGFTCFLGLPVRNDLCTLEVVLGGDESVPIPVLRAFEWRGPITLVQIDAHFDWRHDVGGVTEG